MENKHWFMQGISSVVDFIYYRPRYAMEENWWNLRNKVARFRRGYSYNDTWNIDTWFTDNFVPMVEHLRDNGIGYPIVEGITCPEDWKAILTEMAKGFALYNQAYNGEGIPIPEDEWKEYDLFGRTVTLDTRYHLNEEEMEIFHHSLDLFKKYFPSLWD